MNAVFKYLFSKDGLFSKSRIVTVWMSLALLSTPVIRKYNRISDIKYVLSSPSVPIISKIVIVLTIISIVAGGLVAARIECRMIEIMLEE